MMTVAGASAVRISLGLATNFADVYRFLSFASSFIDHAAGDQSARQASNNWSDMKIICPKPKPSDMSS